MFLFFSKVKVIARLGFKEVISVLTYRLLIKFSLHPVCKIRSKSPTQPFFSKSLLPKSDLPSISAWKDYGSLFSHIKFPLGNCPPDWLANPISGDKSDQSHLPWWKISDFDETTGDVKLIWEQSRMDWVLAFAQRARNGDKNSLVSLNSWLSNWLEKNPPYLGANWKCGQEASIRVIHLCSAALILGQELQPLPSLRHLIDLHLRRIAATIHYAMAQNNNHGTSEAAALYIGGSFLYSNGRKDAAVWEKLGRDWLENRSDKLIENDGSFSQYSLNYHRMLLDTFSIVEVWRKKLKGRFFSQKFYSKARLATSWLYQMVAPSTGDGPNLGANDGARLLQLTDSDYRDYRPTIQLAMALFHERSAYTEPGSWSLQLAWLGIPDATTEPPVFSDCDYDEGGYKLLRSGKAVLMFRHAKFRYRPSQSDILHIDLWVNGANVLRDAGSYSYHSKPDLTAYFSGTASHNTVQFDDRDQMPKLSRFLFGDWLEMNHLSKISQSSKRVSCSAGYRDYLNARHLRKVGLSKSNLHVEDEVSGFTHKAVLRWRLRNSDWRIETIPKGVFVSDGLNKLTVTTSVAMLRANLVDGWESLFYMQKQTVPVLEVEVGSAGTILTEFSWTS